MFIDLTLDDQAQELRKYFKSLGAEISEEKSPKGIEDDLHKVRVILPSPGSGHDVSLSLWFRLPLSCSACCRNFRPLNRSLAS